MFASNMREYEIPRDWIYRGEGNCNVVLSLPNEKKILRIRKIKKVQSIIKWIIDWITNFLQWYCGNPIDEELRDLCFYKKIIRPLIGKSYVCDAEQVFLSKKQIRWLEKKLAGHRPDYRKNKRLQYGRAALFDDYTSLPEDFLPFRLSKDTYAVEIKPKQGWAPFNQKIFPKCKFCMKQYLKRDSGQTKSLSSYCPADLFSGETDRMATAIKALIKNPQNNFKMFRNGTLLYGENHQIGVFEHFLPQLFNTNGKPHNYSLLKDFCLLIQKCLLLNLGTDQPNCTKKLFCEWNQIIRENKNAVQKLPTGCVLERILSVQMLDVEGNQYYAKLAGKNRNRGEYDYVLKLLEEMAKDNRACLKCKIMMLSNDDLVLVPYLISAIANDCSLMLTFRRIEEEICDNLGLKNVVRTDHGQFVVNVGVFDLYPKPVSTILKQKKKMQQMLDICVEQNNFNL